MISIYSNTSNYYLLEDNNIHKLDKFKFIFVEKVEWLNKNSFKFNKNHMYIDNLNCSVPPASVLVTKLDPNSQIYTILYNLYKRKFIPSSKYNGSKFCYFFANGEDGVGYYFDFYKLKKFLH
jgi:hypothetical protein